MKVDLDPPIDPIDPVLVPKLLVAELDSNNLPRTPYAAKVRGYHVVQGARFSPQN